MDSDRDTVEVMEQFKRIYEQCINDLNNCKDEDFREKTKSLRKLLEYLWEQNQTLLSTVDEVEDEGLRQVRTLKRKLEQQTSLGIVDTDKVSAVNEAFTKLVEDMADGKEVSTDFDFTADPDRVRNALKRYMNRLKPETSNENLDELDEESRNNDSDDPFGERGSQLRSVRAGKNLLLRGNNHADNEAPGIDPSGQATGNPTRDYDAFGANRSRPQAVTPGTSGMNQGPRIFIRNYDDPMGGSGSGMGQMYPVDGVMSDELPQGISQVPSANPNPRDHSVLINVNITRPPLSTVFDASAPTYQNSYEPPINLQDPDSARSLPADVFRSAACYPSDQPDRCHLCNKCIH